MESKTMNKTTINELNAFLKGINMAIDNYEKYIESVDNKEVKTEFQKIQQDHKKHAIQVAKRIQDLGGSPADGVGLSGKAAEVMTDIMHIGRTHVKDYLDDAYNGEKQGIKMVDEIVKGDIDSDSMHLVNSILAKDKQHLDTLNQLMGNKNLQMQ